MSHDAAHQGFGHAFECATVELGRTRFLWCGLVGVMVMVLSKLVANGVC